MAIDVLMTRLRPAGYREMQWRNGGGSTTEIAIEPEGAGLQAGPPFLWRLSMARVHKDGPFSCFAGYDRTLVLLEGAGVRLDFGAAAPPVTLAAPLSAVAFAGEWSTDCRLLDGPVRDFNLMVDRKRGAGRVEVFALAAGGRAEAQLRGHTGLLFVVRGAVGVQLGDTHAGEPVMALETARFDRDTEEGPIQFALTATDGPAQLLWMDIELRQPGSTPY